MNSIHARLERKRRDGLYRTRKISEGMARPRRVIDGREVLSFCSNDYLGLASDRRVCEAFHRGVDRGGAGLTWVLARVVVFKAHIMRG